MNKVYLKALIVMVTAILFSGCSQERLLIKGDYGTVEIYRHDDHRRHRDRDKDRDRDWDRNRNHDRYRHRDEDRHEDREWHRHHNKDRDRREHNKKKRYKKIPPGQMPPRGKCRIWIPGVPPGHQPPPGGCRQLSRHVPPGAWLIHG